jgi:hypothetical protein
MERNQAGDSFRSLFLNSGETIARTALDLTCGVANEAAAIVAATTYNSDTKSQWRSGGSSSSIGSRTKPVGIYFSCATEVYSESIMLFLLP